MSEFLPAYNAMIPHECYKDDAGNIVAWCNDSGDHGAETYAGIARHYWPTWEGWLILDSLDKKPYLNTLPALDNLVQRFYLLNFWQEMNLGGLTDQATASYLLDKGTNCGTGTAIRMLQRALALTDDGDCGPKTIAAANRAIPAILISTLRDAFRTHYQAIVAANPSQAKFLKSWLARC